MKEEMTVKIIIASVLCFILCAAFVGCSESTGKSADTGAQSVTAPATETAEDAAAWGNEYYFTVRDAAE